MTNPMENVTKPRKTRKEHTDNDENYFAVPIEVRPKILEALEKEEYLYLKPIIYIMMFAGLRIGEVIALKWKNIDFDASILSVKSSMNKVTEFDDEGNIIGRYSEISDTKTTCSVRQIPISPFLLNVLKSWKEHQISKEENCENKLTNKNAVVFTNRKDKILTYSCVRMKIQRFNKNCGFDNYHAHTFRHTFATMLFEQKVNPKIIQMLMGHRDIRTTFKTYYSVCKNFINDAVSLITQSTNIFNGDYTHPTI